MKNIFTALITGSLLACAPNQSEITQFTSSDIVGDWYGTYSLGRNTGLFNASFEADGNARISHYVCLSSQQQDHHIESGGWTLRDGLMVVSLENNQPDDSEGRHVASYRAIMTTPDYTRYAGIETGMTFWKERKWVNQEYNCTTTKTQINNDRLIAINDGRASATNPLIETKP